jgi:hypothetical protein
VGIYTTKLVALVQYFENELLQIRNVIVDRRLDLEDITVTVFNADDYTKSIISHGRGSVHNDVELKSRKILMVAP